MQYQLMASKVHDVLVKLAKNQFDIDPDIASAGRAAAEYGYYKRLAERGKRRVAGVDRWYKKMRHRPREMSLTEHMNELKSVSAEEEREGRSRIPSALAKKEKTRNVLKSKDKEWRRKTFTEKAKGAYKSYKRGVTVGDKVKYDTSDIKADRKIWEPGMGKAYAKSHGLSTGEGPAPPPDSKI